MNLYEQINHNKRNTWVLIAIFVALFIVIGVGFDHYYGAGAGFPIFTSITFAVSLLAAYASYRNGDKLILSSTHAQRLDLDDPKQKQWQNVIDEMGIAAGIPAPNTYIIDDDDPNAFATGRDPQHSSIAVTKGLLNVLDRDELQAVASHEMSHIKNYDIRLMLMIAALVGSIALISDWGARSLFRGRRRSSSRSSGGGEAVLLLIWLIAIILAPILSRIVAMMVSRRREYLADASGAELTRNPLALASALEKIDAQAGPTRSINQGTAHLCIADPKGSYLNSKEGFVADLFATHPPIQKRIQALRDMAYAK
jgi:heat shock protein HtpX